jgi:SAM-dependent methyltransferase
VRRTQCGGCGSPSLRQFLDLGSTPLADDFPASPDLDAKRWPLGAAVCEACWLVQLTEVVPDDVLWGGDYGFYTGGSPSSLKYFRDYAVDLRGRFLDHIRHGFVVEVACNDGTLLRGLADIQAIYGGKSLGVEPAKGPAEAARAAGLDVITAPFGREVAQSIVDTEGQASLVIANNVLAHVFDLDDFVGGLAFLLAPGGVLSVEVQYLGDLLLGNGFDLLYHEHRSFFSVGTLAITLRRHGLHVHEVCRTSAQGGSVRVTARRQERPDPAATVPGAPGEEWLYGSSPFPSELWRGAPHASMQGRAEVVRDRLRDLVASERAAGRTVVGYGAPAKATTLLHWCGLTSAEDIDVVYDATPSKDGRFMPGTDIPITTDPIGGTLAAHRTTALLLVHNYLPGVLRREREFLGAGGRFLVPLPVPVLL